MKSDELYEVLLTSDVLLKQYGPWSVQCHIELSGKSHFRFKWSVTDLQIVSF